MSECITTNTAKTYFFGPECVRVPKPGEEWFRFEVHLIPEAEGGYSVLTAKLPGAASQGETIAEALENIKEAITGALLTYRESGMPYPFLEHPESLKSGRLKRFVFIELPLK